MLGELETELQSLGAASLVQCRSSQLDKEGYARAQHGFVLKTDSTNLDRLKQVIQSQYNRLYHGGRPAVWAREGSAEVLGTLSPIALETRGPLLAIGSSAAFVRSLLSSPADSRDSSRAVHYYARLDLKQLRPHYLALFQWLDYQAVPASSRRTAALLLSESGRAAGSASAGGDGGSPTLGGESYAA